MKKLLTLFILGAACLYAGAQTTENFLKRYNVLVGRVGFAGVGVQTLLDSWGRADSTDINYMVARYNFYIDRAQKDTVVKNSLPRYLGMDPIMSLTDSTGRKLYYYQETLYDKGLFRKAMYYLDKAIEKNNVRFDLYDTKADILMGYGKADASESSAFIMKMIQRNYTGKTVWETAQVGHKVSVEEFENTIINYCYTFYKVGSPSTMEAFFNISSAMVKQKSANSAFLDNLGAYYLIRKKDYKKAAKMYRQALKMNPDDKIAIKNLELVSSLEKKK